MTTATAQPVGRMMLRNVRLAFPSLFEASRVGTDDKSKPRYSAMLILSPDHPQLAEIRAKSIAVAKEKWKDKAADIFKGLEKSDKLALHDGDTKSQYDGVAGNFFVSAASQESARPTVIDQNKAPLTAKDGKPYAGCYVNVSIDLWAQDNGFGKRINAQLRGVQFLRDGDAFAAGRPADSDEFDEVTEGADAAEFA
jgi:hypothetical protein